MMTEIPFLAMVVLLLEQLKIGYQCIGGSTTSADTCSPICQDGRKVGNEICGRWAMASTAMDVIQIVT